VEICFQHQFADFVAEWWSVRRGDGGDDDGNDDKIDSLSIQVAFYEGMSKLVTPPFTRFMLKAGKDCTNN
jgi:hypothetical protein